MKEDKVKTRNKSNEVLVGIESLPDIKDGKCPAVILVPGLATKRDEYGLFDKLAQHLSNVGIASYRFDLSGVGESQGNYGDSSLTKLKEDLNAILTFVMKQPHVDALRVGLLGQSLGTSASIALHPQVKSLVLMGSFWDPHTVLKKYLGKDYKTDGISSWLKSDGRVIKLKPSFWTDFSNYDLLHDITLFTCPILFIHGSEDTIVPIVEMEPLFEKANQPKKKIILEGGTHNPNEREDVYEIISSWFVKTL